MNARERLIRLLEASAGRTPETPAEQLRTLLNELEIRVANMAGTGEEVLAIPRLLDRAETLLQELEAAGVDLHPERTRLQSVQGHLREKAAIFVREARAAGGLDHVRRQVAPPRERWWWYLDEWVATQRRRRIMRASLLLAAVVGVLVLVGWFVQSRLPDDPRLRRIIELEQEVDIALSDGRLEDAARQLEALRQLEPDRPEHAILLGVVYEALADTEQAQRQYTWAAERLPPDRWRVLRAAAYLQVGWPEKALPDAEEATRLNPEDPEAFFYLASAHEALGNIPAALAAYDRAATLAEAQDRTELLAVIRVRMAYLLQRPLWPTPTLSPEATP